MEIWDFVLPTGESMNPARPEEAEYYDKGQTALVLRRIDQNRTRPTRVVTTFGSLVGCEIGTVANCYHDQTRAYLGEYEVVGYHVFSTGQRAGVVPDRKIRHSVFK